MSMKNPLTPAGIEPATFRFVAQYLNRAYDKGLPKYGALSVETCRRMLIIIHVFHCICACCWYIKDIITVFPDGFFSLCHQAVMTYV